MSKTKQKQLQEGDLVYLQPKTAVFKYPCLVYDGHHVMTSYSFQSSPKYKCENCPGKIENNCVVHIENISVPAVIIEVDTCYIEFPDYVWKTHDILYEGRMLYRLPDNDIKKIIS